MAESSDSFDKAVDLLNRFERVLELDPLIDEIGFIHPSQFARLDEDADSSGGSALDVLGLKDGSFWLRDHKLGISSDSVLPLYKAAINIFSAAVKEYEKYSMPSDKSYSGLSSPATTAESEVMKHSKTLLLISCDFGTVWNSRKLIVSKKQDPADYMAELQLSALVLSYSPKSEQAWCHRRWVIKFISRNCSALQEILEKESQLVERIAEKSKMNYRAWNHRCWLISFMSREQVLCELKKTKNWAALHVADNSCFHYRRRLMLRTLPDPASDLRNEPSELFNIVQEELDWNEELIKRYIGREALWLHRRFLSLCWIEHLATEPEGGARNRCVIISNDIRSFVDHELNLLDTCLTIPDNDYEDYQEQAVYSATYLLWLAKRIPLSHATELKEKLRERNLKILVTSAFPERCSFWDSLFDTSGG